MPLEEDDQQRVDEAIREAGIDGFNKILVRNASESQKLGPPTVMCMILNRTFGKHATKDSKDMLGLTLFRIGYLRVSSHRIEKYWERWCVSPSLVTPGPYNCHVRAALLARTWLLRPQVRDSILHYHRISPKRRKKTRECAF